MGCGLFGRIYLNDIKSKATARRNPGLHGLALLLACATVLLLVAGALVTSNEAGDSVPDWPVSFGRWLISSNNFVANVRFEYSHRVIAGIVGLITLVGISLAKAQQRNPEDNRVAVSSR